MNFQAKWRLPSSKDLLASLVVLIVATPLSLGIALASGSTAAAGLISAILGGIIAGSLAGAPLVVTGPAAGLTAIVYQLGQTHGVAGLAIITVICGLIQLILGMVRLANWFNLIPKAVLEGVLTAIGLTITLGQLHVLAGGSVPETPMKSLMTLPMTYSNVMVPILSCGAIAILIQLFWSKIRLPIQWIPSALPAVLIATLMSSFWDMPRVVVSALGPEMSRAVGNFFSSQMLGLISQNLGVYLFSAAALTLVASAESILTARAVDVLIADRPNQKPSDLNQELIAQGVANTVSGAVGGLPMTAVMVRSAANVNAGAESRWSTVLHGVWIAFFVGLAPAVLTEIPLTALAAVLVVTGFRLTNLKGVYVAARHNLQEGGLWILTTIAILMTDLLIGLMIAIACSILLHLWQTKIVAARAR